MVTLEPVVEVDSDGQLTSLKVRQDLGDRGRNRLKVQSVDIGLYNEENPLAAPLLLKDVTINDHEPYTEVDIKHIPSGFRFGAAYVNEGDHAVAKVRFDSNSLQWFGRNLGQVADPLTRAAVWRHFWLLVMDRKISSVHFFDLASKWIVSEQNDQIIRVAILNFKFLVKSYLPGPLIQEKKQ